MPFTASSGNPIPLPVTFASADNGHSRPNATRSPTGAMLDADVTPEAEQQSADHPQVLPVLPASPTSNVDRQLASVPLGTSAASPISTARSADWQPAKPVASAASAQGSGLEAASEPVCAERRKNSAALPKPDGPDSDPPLSPAAPNWKTPTGTVSAVLRQQAPGELVKKDLLLEVTRWGFRLLKLP